MRTAMDPEKWVSDLSALSALPSILSRHRAGGPWRGFPQFPQAICQSRGPARAGRCQDLAISAISAISATRLRPIRQLTDRSRRFGRFPRFPRLACAAGVSAVSAVSASELSLWRHRARTVGRAGVDLAVEFPKPMTMMPILVLRASAEISHNIVQDCQAKEATASKIILAYRQRGYGAVQSLHAKSLRVVAEGRSRKASVESPRDFRSAHFKDRLWGIPPPCPPPCDGGGEDS